MSRQSHIPLPKNEMFFFDEVDNTFKPVINRDGMMPVQSVQKKWKDSFTRTELSEEKWEVIQVGEGQNIDASNIGDVKIHTGVTPLAETVMLSKEAFTVPMRGLFGFQLSQKIANQEVYLEFVSVDKETLIPDGLHKIAWKISGSDSTTNTNARTITQTGGMTPLESANLSASVQQTGNNALYELELFADEAWYHTRTMDAVTGRAYSAVRHNNIPDPNGYYKMQIRVKNGATAPASNTIVTLIFVNVVDYAELTAEITSGRGSTSAGQGISTTIAGGTIGTVSTVTTANARNSGLWYSETTTPLGANGVFTGVNRTTGSTSAVNYSKIRVRVYSATAGTLYIEQSSVATASTFRCPDGHSFPVTAGQCIQVEVDCLSQFARIKFVNGATAQTAGGIEIISHLVGAS